MTHRRVAEGKLEVPSDASWIDFPRSDGDPSCFPTNIVRVIDDDGQVNFMQPVELSDFTAMRWRLQAAKAIALKLEMPKGPSYILRSWPAGYRMYDHHKGSADDPRHDIYLFGSPKGRFRSINEFIPHAIWLMEDDTMNSLTCACKYCTKRAQKEITEAMSSINILPSNIARAKRDRPRDIIFKKERQREHKLYAAIQRKVTKVSANVVKTPMLAERNSDLRAMCSKTSMNLKRWYREGEMVWCALDNPIPVPGKTGEAIVFWPAVVDEVRLKTVAHPRDKNAKKPYTNYIPSSSSYQDPLGEEDDKGVVLEIDDSHPMPWSVQQSTTYKTRLLGVWYTYVVADENVLPYQAHVPSKGLMEALAGFDPEKLDFETGKPKNFNPFPRTYTPAFQDAVSPYVTALQIGSALSVYYSLTDQWQLKYTIPPSPSPPEPPTTEAPSSSNSRITPQAASSSTSGHATNDMTKSETQDAIQNVLGVNNPPSNGTSQFSQFRFQGMWWGAERIWVDDFVRLKVPRRSLAPNGAPNIYPPSGPGKSTLEAWHALGKQGAEELGAGSRGVFMKLEGLYVIDSMQASGSTKKECRACGMLYELADEDWEEPIELVKQERPGQNDEGRIPPEGHSQLSTSARTVPSTPLIHPGFENPSLESQSVKSTKPPFPLPQAPNGYKFRPILPPGYEAIMSLSLLSGRYYPNILAHPLLDSILREAVSIPLDEGGLMEHNHLWALEGLTPGYHNSVDPKRYKKNRLVMLEDADKIAVVQLREHREKQIKEAGMMEVDG